MASLRYTAAAMVLLVLGCSTERPGVAPPSAGSFAFVVLGDTPYTNEEETRLNRLIDEVNQDELAWVIHIGDIGRHSCSDSLFLARFQLFQQIRHPFVYTPGDNEWTDCHQAARGGFSPLERLGRLRAIFFPDPSQSTGGRVLSVTSQSQNPAYPAFVENTRWVYADMVFMTIHVVGSQNGLVDFPTRTASDDSAFVHREAAAIAWLRAGFARAYEATSRAVFIAIHADPLFQAAAGSPARRGFDPFLAALEEEVARFGGPVVLVHGDTHRYRLDTPLVDRRNGQRLQNFTRLEVFGAPNVGWVRVAVDTANADLFSFQAKRMD